MRILATIILLTCVSMTMSSPETVPVRKFLTKFFKTLRGDTWTLPDNCLAGAFDVDLDKIKAAIKSGDFLTALLYLTDMKKVLAESCPITELSKMEEEINTVIKSGKVVGNIAANIVTLIKLVTDEFKHELEAEDLGAFLGALYKIVVNGSSAPAARFLRASPLALSGVRIQDFISGFIEGSSEVPVESNKCKTTIQQYLPELSTALEELIQAFQAKTGIKEAFVKFMQTAIKVKDSESTCHFADLAYTLATLSSPITLAKVGFRITTQLSTFISHVKESVNAFKAGDHKTVGVHVGGIFQIAFKYATQ